MKTNVSFDRVHKAAEFLGHAMFNFHLLCRNGKWEEAEQARFELQCATDNYTDEIMAMYMAIHGPSGNA